MTARHRRSAHTLARAAGVLAIALALYGAGLIHGSGVGHADATNTTVCTEPR